MALYTPPSVNGSFPIVPMFIYCATKWPFPRHRELNFGLEFERSGFEERFIFNEGSSNPIRDHQVIRVAGVAYFAN